MKRDNRRAFRSWIELSKNSLFHNLRLFRKAIGKKVKLAAVVKANAYGHGLKEIISLLREKVDLFAVDSLEEALAIRGIDLQIPILIMGYLPLADLSLPIEKKISFVVYNLETLKKIIALKLTLPAQIHLKIETGLNRQGIRRKDLRPFLRLIKKYRKYFLLEGISTHFANI